MSTPQTPVAYAGKEFLLNFSLPAMRTPTFDIYALPFASSKLHLFLKQQLRRMLAWISSVVPLPILSPSYYNWVWSPHVVGSAIIQYLHLSLTCKSYHGPWESTIHCWIYPVMILCCNLVDKIQLPINVFIVHGLGISYPLHWIQ